MKITGEKTAGPLRGVAALFDDTERKELFRKYLYFLGWVEILILLTCWLYQISDSGRDPALAADSTFPWRLYFLVAFLAPLAITFLVGVVIVGFNKYLGEEPAAAGPAVEQEAPAGAGRIQQINRMVTLVQRLPFLALLLLLGLGVGFFYKLDAIVSLIGSVGEKSAKVFLVSAGVILVLVSVFAFILVLLNYRLRKRAMEYQYKSQVAERFGLIILEDNTVLNSEGRLLVNGKKWKDAVPLLPEATESKPPAEAPGTASVRRPADLET
jgi:membrane protein implicated in regulation of membrane protease activity